MRRALTSLLLFPAVTSPALAQDKETQIGSRLPRDFNRDAQSYALPKVRAVQSKFGECVVKKHPDEAVRYVLALSSDERKPLTAKVADGDCLANAAESEEFNEIRMTLTSDFMQYALADALVRKRYASGPLTDLSAVAPLAHEQPNPADYAPPPGKTLKPAQLQDLEARKLRAQAYAYLSQYGECVVRANPAESFNLLMANPGSPEEGASIGRLSSALQNCLDAGRTIELNKASLRGTIAHNYYRLAAAPRLPAVQSADKAQ